MNAAMMPATVPVTVIPPSTPAGTEARLVIKYARRPAACPISLETVSAAASHNAAVIAVSSNGAVRGDITAGSAVIPATPRFDNTCDPLRPSFRSASPAVCFRCIPNLVANCVKTNTVSTVRNPPGPAATVITNARMVPVRAPVTVTPRIPQATSPNPTVIPNASSIRPWLTGTPAYDQRQMLFASARVMKFGSSLAAQIPVQRILTDRTCGARVLPQRKGLFMPASVWTGYLTFGLISMPVRLFSGARGERVSFHMLHRKDLSRVKQQLYCPVDEEVVERDDIVKGYEYRKGEYVVVEPEEIRKIEPPTAKAMEILEFVNADEVDPLYFESSYYLAPEDAGKRPYALLARAMRETNYVAIAKLTMHNREYTVFLRPYEDGLMLHTMYYEDEVRRMESFGTENIELKDAEVKVAHQLIEALATEFEPEKFHDTFQENLKQLIQARLEGSEIAEVQKPRKPQPVTDLMAALKESLATAEKKGPQRVARQAKSRITEKKPAAKAQGKRGRVA